jgi:hypothetical protein
MSVAGFEPDLFDLAEVELRQEFLVEMGQLPGCSCVHIPHPYLSGVGHRAEEVGHFLLPVIQGEGTHRAGLVDNRIQRPISHDNCHQLGAAML